MDMESVVNKLEAVRSLEREIGEFLRLPGLRLHSLEISYLSLRDAVESVEMFRYGSAEMVSCFEEAIKEPAIAEAIVKRAVEIARERIKAAKIEAVDVALWFSGATIRENPGWFPDAKAEVVNGSQ